jgi:hypothetical protein
MKVAHFGSETILAMRYVLSRLWDIIVGLVMIALGLAFQLLLFLMLAVGAIPMVLPQLNPFVSLIALFIVFNVVACVEYFRRRQVVVAHALASESSQASSALFLTPRGIDRIFRGREFTGRPEDAECPPQYFVGGEAERDWSE